MWREASCEASLFGVMDEEVLGCVLEPSFVVLNLQGWMDSKVRTLYLPRHFSLVKKQFLFLLIRGHI